MDNGDEIKLGVAIRFYRSKLGITQNQLLVMMGKRAKSRVLTDYENDIMSPTFNTICVFAKAFNIQPSKLIEAAEDFHKIPVVCHDGLVKLAGQSDLAMPYDLYQFSMQSAKGFSHEQTRNPV